MARTRAATTARLDAAAQLRGANLRITPQRQMLVEILEAARPQHLTADEILGRVVERYPAFNRSTVYRTLESLCEAGLVVQHQLLGPVAYFELGGRVHHHLVCRHCGRVLDLDSRHLEQLTTGAAAQHGFAVGAVGLTIAGYCAECAGAS